MPKSSTSVRSGLRVFDPDYDLLPGEASLEAFPLAPPSFKPQKNGDILEDGQPISRLGERFRVELARHNDISEDEVPHGLIRLVEAISADNRENEQMLGTPRLLRNRLGHLVVVPFVFLSTLVFPWLINGRAHQRLAKRIRKEQFKLLTQPRDHDRLLLPTIDVESVDQVLAHYEAQRQILGLHEYSGRNRDFIDDIAWNGVLEEVVVAPTYLANGNTGTWTAQATDGARRLTAEHEIQRRITGQSPAVFQRAWFTPDMRSKAFREIDAATIERLHDASTFPDFELQILPSSSSQEAISRWMEIAEASMEVRILQRTRTVRGLLVLAAKPNRLGHPAHRTSRPSSGRSRCPTRGGRRCWDGSRR